MIQNQRSRGLLSTALLMFLAAGVSQTKKVPCYAGSPYGACTPTERETKARLLAQARTAAVLVEATQTISCGDGSEGCFRKDATAAAIIEHEVDLCAYDSESNDLLWCEYRNPSIALDNDASREIKHFMSARIAVQGNREATRCAGSRPSASWQKRTSCFVPVCWL